MSQTSFEAPSRHARSPRQAFGSALAAALVALALALGGCRDSTGPAELLSYSLREVGGQPLPIVISTADTGQLALVAEYITLKPDGSAVQQWSLRFQGPPGEYGPPAPVYIDGSRTLRYHRTIAWLQIKMPRMCEGTALCAPPVGEGPIVDGELTLQGLQPPGLGDQPRHFRRVGSQRSRE